VSHKQQYVEVKTINKIKEKILIRQLHKCCRLSCKQQTSQRCIYAGLTSNQHQNYKILIEFTLLWFNTCEMRSQQPAWPDFWAKPISITKKMLSVHPKLSAHHSSPYTGTNRPTLIQALMDLRHVKSKRNSTWYRLSSFQLLTKKLDASTSTICIISSRILNKSLRQANQRYTGFHTRKIKKNLRSPML
jgi:hypothetical protein